MFPSCLSRVGTELRNIHVANTGVIFVRNTEVCVRRILSLAATCTRRRCVSGVSVTIPQHRTAITTCLQVQLVSHGAGTLA